MPAQLSVEPELTRAATLKLYISELVHLTTFQKVHSLLKKIYYIYMENLHSEN